jgi:anti-sigma B factor antagonist
MMGSFSIRRQRQGPVRRIMPSGELDLASVPVLRGEFEFARDDPGVAMIVLDLTRLTFIDSTGIGVLLHMSAECAETDRLRLVNGSPAIGRLIDLMGVRHRLPIVSLGDDPLAPLPGVTGRREGA